MQFQIHQCVNDQVLVEQNISTDYDQETEQQSSWAAWLSPPLLIMSSSSTLPPFNEGVYLVDLCFLDPFLAQLLNNIFPEQQSQLEFNIRHLETVWYKLGCCAPLNKRLVGCLSSDCEWNGATTFRMALPAIVNPLWKCPHRSSSTHIHTDVLPQSHRHFSIQWS